MNAPFELLVGSKNRKKAAEIRRLLLRLPVDVLDLSAFEDLPDVPEEGDTFEANAITKAAAFAKLTGLPTIADDSGLEVDALGGRPGVYSARFAGPQATDVDNNRLLLEMLANTPPLARTARFRAVVAFATPDECVFASEGSVEGVITDRVRGPHGFGYDPLFFVAELGGTFGEVDPDVKDTISHRARALAEFRRRFTEYLAARAASNR